MKLPTLTWKFLLKTLGFNFLFIVCLQLFCLLFPNNIAQRMAVALHAPTCSNGGYMTEEMAKQQPSCQCHGFTIFTIFDFTARDGGREYACLGYFE